MLESNKCCGEIEFVLYGRGENLQRIQAGSTTAIFSGSASTETGPDTPYASPPPQPLKMPDTKKCGTGITFIRTLGGADMIRTLGWSGKRYEFGKKGLPRPGLSAHGEGGSEA